MTVGDFLLKETKVGDVVVLRDCGWYVGLTKIDHEDLFIHVLSKHCTDREVQKIERDQWYEIVPGTKIKVTEVWYK